MSNKNGELLSGGKSSGRIYWLDVARVVAIISITLNHAVNRSYSTHTNQLAEFISIPVASSALKAVIYVFSRLGVPIFVMISGALLLKKDIKTEKDIIGFYKHNLLRLFITSEIWFFFYFCYQTIINGTQRSIFNIAIDFVLNQLMINQNIFLGAWYMPMILCLYLLVPFIAMLKDRVSFKTASILLAAVFYISYVIPTLSCFSTLIGKSEFYFGLGEYAEICSMYIVLLVIGYWLSNGGLSRLSNGIVIAGFLLTFLGTCAFQFYVYSIPHDYETDYHFAGIFFCAVFLFELIRRKGDLLKFAQRPVTYLSRIAFGIYLVHIVIMTVMVDFAPLNMSQPLKMVVLELVSFIGSIIIIAPLSKIPFVRKYVFMIK